LFHGLGNAVPADGLRSESGHDADDERAEDRHHDDPWSEPVVGGRRELRREPPEEREVRDEGDEAREKLRDDARDEGAMPTERAEM
jgi:hypothetical protein